jgi:hypothetical protein
MKLIHGILSCALVAGLTAHAAPSQNGTVIGNTVYTPLNIKLQTQFTNSKGKVREASLTSKDLISLLGFPKDAKLATDYDGFGDNADVVVIENGAILEDLTTDNIFSIDFNVLVPKLDKNKNGVFTESERGLLSLNFDFINIDIVPPPPQNGIAAKGSAQLPPGDEFFFEATGVYDWSESGGAIKGGDQKIATKLNGFNLVGDGFEDTNVTPTIKSNVSNSESDFLIKDGYASGNGGGTVGVD